MPRTRKVPHRCAGYVATRHGRVRCLKRRAMRMRWDQYERIPKCPACGGRKWWIDQHRRRRADRRVCYCHAHPHRPGSLTYCEKAREPDAD